MSSLRMACSDRERAGRGARREKGARNDSRSIAATGIKTDIVAVKRWQEWEIVSGSEVEL